MISIHKFTQSISEKHLLAWIIVISTVLRLIAASTTSLGNDEVYYFTYAVQPDWNHFDHPPLVGLFIRLFTFNLTMVNEVTVRLAAIAGAALNTWLIARAGMLLLNYRAGIIAGLLYNVCIYTSIISGTFIIPDSIQLTFWLLALLTALESVTTASPQQLTRKLIFFGLYTGLAMMCKIHAAFLWYGMFGFIAFQKPSWLKNRGLYTGLLISIAIISPIVFWNIDNDFITWRFHRERVEVNQGLNFKSFLMATIGQIAYLNPVIFVTIIFAWIQYKSAWIKNDMFSLLMWISLPIIICTLVISMFRATLPHWSGPGFIGLLLLTAVSVASNTSLLLKKLISISVAFTSFVFLVGPLLINFYPGTLSPAPDDKLGAGDFTLDMYGWNQLLPAFQKIRKQDIADEVMSAEAPMIVHKWFPGAHVLYYTAYPLKIPVRGVGNMQDLHKFVWMNQLSEPLYKGENAYFITTSNNFAEPVTLFAEHFARIEKAKTITQQRSGKVARYWYVYRLYDAKKCL
jgi:hypothetical protein